MEIKDKDLFLANYGVTEKFNNLEKSNPDLWNTLLLIGNEYSKELNQKYLRDQLNSFIGQIKPSKHIHSIRYRMKEPESLLVKIIEKMYSSSKRKYTNISVDNYYKIVTDLLGARIIVRYKNEWKYIHEMIWEQYHNDKIRYLVDYEKDYSPEGFFIAEQPIVFLRHNEQLINYQCLGENIFKIEKSDEEYSSIHYTINYNGRYIELQVRTIYEEAWAECYHDFIYKLNACNKKLILKSISKILTNTTDASDRLSSLIRDYATDRNSILDDYLNEEENEKDKNLSDNKLENMMISRKKENINFNKISDVLDMF